MKKLYTLLLIATAFTINAQVTNGDFETWTDPTTLASFSPSPFTAAVTKESTIKHGGLFSAKHTTPLVTVPATATSVKIQNETTAIVAGHSYTISYWYLDNDANAKARPWIYWITSTLPATTIADPASDLIFRPTTYSADSPSWTQFTTTMTAPATAAKLRFEVRSYNVGTVGGGVIYYDDMTVIDNTLMAVSYQNQIEGLKIFVSNKQLNVISDSNDLKSVVVYNILGKQVINTTTSGNPINVSELSSGIYIVKVTENGKSNTLKVVIQ